MLQFFKYVLATVAGIFVFFILGFVILVGIGSAMSSKGTSYTVKDNSVLRLDLNQIIVENAPEKDPFAELFGETITKVGLVDLKEAIANAAKDPKIKGIYLKSEYPEAGFSTLSELRKYLTDFQKTGKFIYSYGEYMTEKGYYIASVADTLILEETGSLELNGLAANITFFTGLFEKIGVKPEIFRVGEYKGAVEPFFRKSLSPENKEQITSYINDIAKVIYKDMATSRKIAPAAFEELLNNPVTTTTEAAEKKLITKTGYRDEIETLLRKKTSTKKSDDIPFVTLENYLKAEKTIKEGSRNNRIAVIVSQGDIVTGEGTNESIGAVSFIKELRKAVEDDKIKAIILRINSGGGSAIASDEMWREIQLAKKEKPIYASMGDYAASGGYYLAMGCDTIIANPTTVTGSIGIFGMLFDAQELLNNKLGLTFESVETHEHADFPNLTKTMPEAEKWMIQKSVNEGYERFTAKAAKGRNMPVDQLKAIASGRVWTGNQAKENGLVDILGSLDDAIELAAKKAKIADDYQVKYYPTPKTDIEVIMEKLTNQSKLKLREQLGVLAPHLDEINSLFQMDQVQARVPFSLDVK